MIAALYARPQLAALGTALLGLALLVTPGHTEERPGQTHIDLFDAKSNRTAYGVVDEKTGHVDLYDTKSNRTGYRTIDANGRLDFYDTKGSRTGAGQVTPAPTTRPGGRR